ncbi:recombinase family protein [Salmonella enterica]|nr:recombinase family protein [Salmonella enterica]
MSNVGYIRVSTTQQNTDRQLHGTELDKVFVEKVSGKNIEREQLKAMLAYVREGDTVHCHEVSRLGRNTRDVLNVIHQLKDKGVVVKFHKEGLTVGDNNPMGEMMLTMMAGFAQMEREMMLERQAEAYAVAKAAGKQIGRGNGKAVDRVGIVSALAAGGSIRQVAKDFAVSTQTVQRIKKEQEAE